MGLCATDFSRSANSNSPDHAVPATTGIRFDARGVVSGVVGQTVPRACNSGTSNWWVSNGLGSNGLRRRCGCGRVFVAMGLGATDLVPRLLRRHFRKATAGAGWLWVVPRDAAWCWMVLGVLGGAGKRMVWVPDERRSGLPFMRRASGSCWGRQAGEAGFCAVARGSRIEAAGR